MVENHDANVSRHFSENFDKEIRKQLAYQAKKPETLAK